MRTRAMTAEHQEAATRRLAQLSSQLEAERAARSSAASAGAEEWWGEHTRVVPVTRPAPSWPSPDDDVGEEDADDADVADGGGSGGPLDGARPVPMPGRHASRRSPLPGERTAGLTAWVPETLRGRVGLGPPHLAVVALLVAVGALAVAWFVVRGDPATPVPIAVEQAAAAAPPLAESLAGGEAGAAQGSPLDAADAPAAVSGTGGAGGAGGAGGSGGVATTPAAAGTVTVDVAGKVRRPGIAVLDAGSRVVDALEAAGGARPGVDLVALNLARVLVDGEQIVVGAPAGAVAAPVTGGAGGTTAAPGAPTALVDLNLATEPELEELPDVGPVTAAAIVSWREQNGGFTAVTELLEVDGIGDKTLEQLTPLVTV